MLNDMTDCPNCQTKKTVAEYDNCFQCTECANWGYAANRLPYSVEQAPCWQQDGQVCRKPRAA